ncbi:MAG: hypothetical protein MJA29_00695, partial [Candidatus Omnitrophica bacterium]|nr:hypothetical protein [Candidatus Omnitrophota bacterium]
WHCRANCILIDIEMFFAEYGCNEMKLFPDFINMGERINELRTLLKLYLLMYADDTIIISETADGLQKNLDALSEYCDKWKLKINTDKTKILIFTRKKKRIDRNFLLNGRALEKVEEYNYLGVIFSKNGNFFKARKHLSDQATKALFSVLQKGNALNLPVDLRLQLFDETISPILLYGSEVWGYEDMKLLETIHLKYCKYLLKLKKTTPSCMVYGETGRYPMELFVKCRMVNFWCRLILDNTNKISSVLYKIMLDLHCKNMLHSAWIVHIEKILNDCGMSNLWLSQEVQSMPWVKHAIRLRFQDQFKQQWFETLQSSDSCRIYRLFKNEHKFEQYLNDDSTRITLGRFRTSNSKLPVNSFVTDINEADRSCQKCNNNNVGDEIHFLFQCPSLKHLREWLIPTKFLKRQNALQFAKLITTNNKTVKYKLIKFIALGLKNYNS